MSLKIKEFVIKASFKDEQNSNEDKIQQPFEGNLQAIKAEILDECMEKIEAYLERKEGR